MRMFFALDTFFVADQCVVESAYKTYSQVVRKAARLPGVDVLFICSEPVEVDSEEMKKDLITQFRVERPNEDFESYGYTFARQSFLLNKSFLQRLRPL